MRDITDRKRDEAERRRLEACVVRAQRMEGIGAVMCDVVQLASNLVTANVQIHTSLPEHFWAFAGDSTQIQQVLLNLLLNARDAMPGGGTITIAARNAELGAGASHFLAKPFTADALLTTRDGAERGIGGSAGLSMGALGAMRASALPSR